jgi:hypothetical protein
VVPKPLPAAPLVAHCNYFIAVPRPMLAAPSRYLIAMPRPLPAAPLVVRHRYLTAVPRPMLAAPPQVLDRNARAAARGAARFASQVIGRGAQAVSHGAACCSLHVLDRGARAVSRGAATPIAVRQGRQGRDAVAAGEEQLDRCSAEWLFPWRRSAQTQMAQKPMLRAEVHALHARALRASQNVKRAEKWVGARCA